MSLASLLPAKEWFRGRSLGRDLRRAAGNPLLAWKSVHRWSMLSHHADLPYADLVRYRREYLDDREFQDHLGRSLRDVHYTFSGLPELYTVVRAFKPSVVVETGVASGMSSAHILRALAANNAGVLHSIDLPNVRASSTLPPGRTSGWMVPDALRKRWTLHIGDTRKLLPVVLDSLAEVSLFLHDSDHSYEAMSFEFEQAFRKLASGGLLMSDDIHLHAAWDDFCARRRLHPTRIENLGITRKRR